jgi:hypothetical protein
MANREHLRILKRGVKAWNAWREQNRSIRPDLSNADLSDTDLSNADLSRAILYEADLWKADLHGASLAAANLYGASLFEANLNGANLIVADLTRADLTAANLSEADLTEADFFRADLTEANLSRADLTEAGLHGANLTEANLTGATLSHAEFVATVFGSTNLTAVQRLETCRHDGPSTLDHRTLARSGLLPLAFLRGCGLPETLIEYLPSILGEPFQFYSCFISYSSADEDFCRRLHGRLQDAGLRVWFAPHDIQGGRKLHEQIDTAIRVYDKLLLVLSPHSMQSPWVEFESRRARKREVAEQRRLLFPVRLVDYEAIKAWECFDADTAKDLATEIREYYIPDFMAWKDHDAFEAAVTRLLRDLKDPERKPDGTA